MPSPSSIPHRATELLRRLRWCALPFLSAILLILSFYPFHFWILGFVALVPIIYATETGAAQSWKRIFAGGFIFGFLFPLALMRATVMQFTWTPEAHLFQTIIRWSSLPISLVIGLLYGAMLLLYAKKLRTPSPLKNVFIFSLVWALIEWFITVGTGGYNLGILAHAASTIPFLMSLAAIGGIHFVSFIVILCNSMIALAFTWRKIRPETYSRKKYITAAGCIIASVSILFATNTWYLRHNQPLRNLSVAALQNSDRKQGAFGEFRNDKFSFEKLSSLIRSAQNSSPKPDLIIYPFSVSKEILADDTSAPVYVATAPLREFAAWTETSSQGGIFVTWNTIERGSIFFNEIDYWDKDAPAVSYQKKHLFPFMDYTPSWAQRVGLYSTAVDEAPGAAQQPSFRFKDARIASAVCSEINDSPTIHANTAGADVLFSIGSDAMFSDSFAAESDLTNAQFRAAENNVAVIRANRFGPSGSVAPNGALMIKTSYNEDGAFILPVRYEHNPRTTLYRLTGDIPFVFLGLMLVIALPLL